MAGGIDLSNRKPRRMRGTPALKFSNRLGFAVLGFGVTCGLLINQLPIIKDIQKKFNFDLLTVSEEEKDRRQIFNFTTSKTSSQLQKLIEDRKRIDEER